MVQHIFIWAIFCSYHHHHGAWSDISSTRYLDLDVLSTYVRIDHTYSSVNKPTQKSTCSLIKKGLKEVRVFRRLQRKKILKTPDHFCDVHEAIFPFSILVFSSYHHDPIWYRYILSRVIAFDAPYSMLSGHDCASRLSRNDGTWTHDLTVPNRVFYHLNYIPNLDLILPSSSGHSPTDGVRA